VLVIMCGMGRDLEPSHAALRAHSQFRIIRRSMWLGTRMLCSSSPPVSGLVDLVLRGCGRGPPRGRVRSSSSQQRVNRRNARNAQLRRARRALGLCTLQSGMG